MNHKKLLNDVATKSGVQPADVESVMNMMLDGMYDTLAEGDALSVYSFGIFSLKQTQGRRMYNPKTKKSEQLPPRQTLTFHVSPAFKDKCNN